MGTLADVMIISFMASRPVVARVVEAFTERDVAVLPIKSRQTGAGVVINSILTCSTIKTRQTRTVVSINITVSAHEAIATLAYVGIPNVNTLSIIGARARTAVINFLFTVEPRVTGWALTAVSTSRSVRASPSIKAGPVLTFHSTQFTIFPMESRWAGTRILVLQICAASTIFAGISITFIDLCFTVGPSEARAARTSVTPLTSVCACRSVLARFVMCTIIQVLVAKQTAPSFLTVTLPRLLTCSMKAPWIMNALITVTSLPSHPAFAFPRFLAQSVLFVAARKADRFIAVGPLPARVTHLFPLFAAAEVAEGIISGAAEDGAALPVVMLVADEAVRVFEFCPGANMDILRPLVPHGEVSLGSQAADKTIRIICAEVIGGVCM